MIGKIGGYFHQERVQEISWSNEGCIQISYIAILNKVILSEYMFWYDHGAVSISHNGFLITPKIGMRLSSNVVEAHTKF